MRKAKGKHQPRPVNSSLTYTLYKTTNNINGKWYIGVHRTDDPDDRYLGSGQAILDAIKKYGRKNFSKKILASFDDRELAYFVESHYVTDKEVADPSCYNLRPGGGSTSEEHLKTKCQKLKTRWHERIWTDPKYENLRAESLERKAAEEAKKQLLYDDIDRIYDELNLSVV